MSKLYYTNPLHAAIMAQEFGVRLGTWFEEDGESEFHEIYVDLDHSVQGVFIDDSATSVSRYHNNYYIHPDSYHVFEPMELDFGLSNKDIQYQFEDGRWLWANQEELDDNEVVEIIHRNFKPFFTPEEEAA